MLVRSRNNKSVGIGFDMLRLRIGTRTLTQLGDGCRKQPRVRADRRGRQSVFILMNCRGDELVKRTLYWKDLLARTLKPIRMIGRSVLDSAGGIGRLEFQTMLETMGSTSYALFLDDTHHLKHFRSLQAIRSSPDFRLIRMAKDAS